MTRKSRFVFELEKKLNGMDFFTTCEKRSTNRSMIQKKNETNRFTKYDFSIKKNSCTTYNIDYSKNQNNQTNGLKEEISGFMVLVWQRRRRKWREIGWEVYKLIFLCYIGLLFKGSGNNGRKGKCFHLFGLLDMRWLLMELWWWFSPHLRVNFHFKL